MTSTFHSRETTESLIVQFDRLNARCWADHDRRNSPGCFFEDAYCYEAFMGQWQEAKRQRDAISKELASRGVATSTERAALAA